MKSDLCALGRMAMVVNGMTASGHVLPRGAEKSIFNALFIHSA